MKVLKQGYEVYLQGEAQVGRIRFCPPGRAITLR